MASKVVTGARTKVYVNNQLVGIFDSCSYSTNIGIEPIFILGRYSASEITPTSYEAVTLQCSGFRLVDEGSKVLPAVPMVQDLLTLDGVTLAVVDRQSGKSLLTVLGAVGHSDSGNYNAKATSKINISYTGIIASTEAGNESESSGASDLP